jgi:hypothetical protein
MRGQDDQQCAGHTSLDRVTMQTATLAQGADTQIKQTAWISLPTRWLQWLGQQCFAEEIREKVRTKQARVVEWDAIKDNPPTELKISPIAAIPHKSKAYRSILDLSFQLRLKNGVFRDTVNETTVKTAPRGAIDQIGECLSRIIHAFAEAEEDAKVFMAKWDIKDGFWCMDCREGKEWNLLMYSRNRRASQSALLCPHCYKWAGWNHLLISALL